MSKVTKEAFFKDAIKSPIVIVESKKETLYEALNRFKEKCKPELIKAANATGRNYHDLWLEIVPLILKFNPCITV
jgi:hypothetical protein